MSYPRDLDEIPEHELVRELENRAESRANGLCDYCHREPSTTPCKFPGRHTGRGELTGALAIPVERWQAALMSPELLAAVLAMRSALHQQGAG